MVTTYIIPFSNDDIQIQTFSLYDINWKLGLYYNEVSYSFLFSLENLTENKYIVRSKGLVCGAPALLGSDTPFVLTLVDKTGTGVDPLSKQDFFDRMQIILVDKNDYNEINKSQS